MSDSCPHGHYRHTHTWLLGDEDPMWMGVVIPPGSDLGRYEPCPETDPDRTTGDAQ